MLSTKQEFVRGERRLINVLTFKEANDNRVLLQYYNNPRNGNQKRQHQKKRVKLLADILGIHDSRLAIMSIVVLSLLSS
jgi:hypothetical protein